MLFGETLKTEGCGIYSFGRAVKDEFDEAIRMARNSMDSAPAIVTDDYF